MPERKVSDRCPTCAGKNPVTDHYCGSCGHTLTSGRYPAKPFEPIAHPIDDDFRLYLVGTILERCRQAGVLISGGCRVA